MTNGPDKGRTSFPAHGTSKKGTAPTAPFPISVTVALGPVLSLDLDERLGAMAIGLIVEAMDGLCADRT